MAGTNVKRRRLRSVKQDTYSAEQLATIASSFDRRGKLILGLAVNAALKPNSLVNLKTAHFQDRSTETLPSGMCLTFIEPRFQRFKDVVLWNEVSELVKWGTERAKNLRTEYLITNDDGHPWLRNDTQWPARKVSRWWREKVTKLDVPYIPFDRVRRVLRHGAYRAGRYGLADFVLLGVRVGQISDSPIRLDADSTLELADHFRPFLNALRKR